MLMGPIIRIKRLQGCKLVDISPIIPGVHDVDPSAVASAFKWATSMHDVSTKHDSDTPDLWQTPGTERYTD